MTTTRAAPCLSSTVLPALVVSTAAAAPEARRPAGGLLSHSFSDVAEDTVGVAPERPEASPEPALRINDPAVPAPGRLPR